MMNTMYICLLIIVLAYSVLILSYAYFFSKFNGKIPENQMKDFIKVSIIIPARNESHCISALLYAIKDQSYPSAFIEMIIVDDASTDDTLGVVRHFADQYPKLNCKIISIKDDAAKPTYKKFAISKAIKISDGVLIITTDADCMVGPDWVSGIVSLYMQTNAKMLVGLVAYMRDEGWFQKMQHLEFLSLIASGVAAVESGYPIMCNGANLIYERKAFDEVNGFDANDQYASGDDVFLLLKMKKHFGKNSIFVLNDKYTMVYTQAKETLSEFTQQRLRWASKTKGYKDFTILLVAGIVFAFNICILLSLVLGILNHAFLSISLYLFVIKLVVDFPIMLGITSFINRKDLLVFYIPLQIVYLPYVLIIGSIGNFVSYSWKGRTIK